MLYYANLLRFAFILPNKIKIFNQKFSIYIVYNMQLQMNIEMRASLFHLYNSSPSKIYLVLKNNKKPGSLQSGSNGEIRQHLRKY